MAGKHFHLLSLFHEISFELFFFSSSRPLSIFNARQQEAAARKLGINSSFIKGDYCYVLVRVSRFRETARLIKPIPPNQMLHDDVSAKIQDMQPGNSTETIQFMTTFGTHYINSYVTGNSLYQVCNSKFIVLFEFKLICFTICSFRCLSIPNKTINTLKNV